MLSTKQIAEYFDVQIEFCDMQLSKLLAKSPEAIRYSQDKVFLQSHKKRILLFDEQSGNVCTTHKDVILAVEPHPDFYKGFYKGATRGK